MFAEKVNGERNFRMSLKIGIITDIHAGLDNDYIKGSVALELLDEALEGLRLEHPAILIELGDRTNDDSLEIKRNNVAELGKRFNALTIPRHHLLGNHDFLPKEEQEQLLNAQLSNHSVVIEGWQFIFLYSFNGTVEGGLTEGDLNWLGQTLASNSFPAIVFTHQPLDGVPTQGNSLFDAIPHYLTPTGHEKARAIMEASGKVKLAINGHTHWNHLEKIKEISYLSLTAVTPLVGSKEMTTAYSVLILNKSAITIKVYGREPAEFHIA
jgi:3',5'-cyclic-AMP phosphodiesterase